MNMQDFNNEMNYSPDDQPMSHFKPRQTVNIGNPSNVKMSKPTATMYTVNKPSKSSQAKGNFNYWNSV